MVVTERDLARWLLRRRRGRAGLPSCTFFTALDSGQDVTVLKFSSHSTHCACLSLRKHHLVSQANRNKTRRKSVVAFSSKRSDMISKSFFMSPLESQLARLYWRNHPPSRHVPMPTRLNSSLSCARDCLTPALPTPPRSTLWGRLYTTRPWGLPLPPVMEVVEGVKVWQEL